MAPGVLIAAQHFSFSRSGCEGHLRKGRRPRKVGGQINCNGVRLCFSLGQPPPRIAIGYRTRPEDAIKTREPTPAGQRRQCYIDNRGRFMVDIEQTNL